MNDMRILMTTDTIGGVWTFAMELVAALKACDTQVALVTMGRAPNTDQRLQMAQLTNATVHPSEFRLEWMNNPWEDIRHAGQWLLKLRDRFRPDVIHLNSFALAALPWKVPVLVTAHSCAQSWWEAVRETPPPLERWQRYNDAVTAGLHAADLVVAPSHVMAETIERLYRLSIRPHVIHNGRTAAAFMPGPKHPFILSTGRLWDEAKNLATLDKAAAGLSWPVYVAGPLQHPDRLAAASIYNVRLLGTLPPMHMRQWMSRADIYALPARYEPFGLSVLEAALAGCALVLGDIPSLREIWGETAVYTPPDDADALRAELTGLIKNPKRRVHLAAAARTRALALSADQMAEAYAALYTDLCATALPDGVSRRLKDTQGDAIDTLTC